MIDNHLSFRPAAEIIKAFEASVPSTAERARSELAAVRKLIRRPAGVPDIKRLTAQSWGATPQETRRFVLRKAGIDVNRWDCPIHSFNDSERAAIKASALGAVRVFERVLNAV